MRRRAIGNFNIPPCKLTDSFTKVRTIRTHSGKFGQIGTIWTMGGLPNSEKVRAIVNAPEPKDVSQLKSYLGILNYYGRFIPNLSTEIHELNELLGKFEWSEKCQKSFERSKILVTSNQVLELYDPEKEIIMSLPMLVLME